MNRFDQNSLEIQKGSLADNEVLSGDEQQQATAEPLRTGTVRCFDGIEFVYIEPGEFDMGTNDGADDEKPVHRVKISRGFWMGRYPLTCKQWESLMPLDDVWMAGDDYPVEICCWGGGHEALQKEFIKRLNEKSCGRALSPEAVWLEKVSGCYRLPTEAEWEYACRAGTETRFFWGDSTDENIVKEYAWYKKNACEKDLDGNFWTEPHAEKQGLQPVGRKKPNPWGLYDMCGNVREQVLDFYDYEFYRKCGPEITDPLNLHGGGYYLAYRGGSFSYDASDLYSAIRGGKEGTDCRMPIFGFRLVRQA
jgi:formylglycine-generating enzyme required for sulfatase activity